MLNYEEFKTALLGELPSYLPAKYGEWEVYCREVVKVNGVHDAIHVMPPAGHGGSPTLYIQEFFDYYKVCGSLERTCQKAAAIFVVGMDYVSKIKLANTGDLPKDRIIFVLIPQSGNERLLSEVPHRLIMDLAVIYRFAMEAEDGMNSAIVTSDMAEELHLAEEELYQLAMKNTPKILPLDLHKGDDQFCLLTNELCVFGASTMLYPGVLGSLAEEADGDLFILPCSLQEIIVVPDVGQDVQELNRVIRAANEMAIPPEEILSDHAYYYHRATDQICIPNWE